MAECAKVVEEDEQFIIDDARPITVHGDFHAFQQIAMPFLGLNLVFEEAGY